MAENLAADVRAFTSNVFYMPGERPALVDVGANFDLVSRLDDRGLAPETIVVTHTHDDHVGNVDAVRDEFGIETIGWDPSHPAVDHGLDDGEAVAVGDATCEVLFTPGHAPDHVCLYDPGNGVLFAGDLVFGDGNVGRTDLPGSNHAELVESVDRVRERCAEVCELHPGHGPSATDDPAAALERAAEIARF